MLRKKTEPRGADPYEHALADGGHRISHGQKEKQSGREEK
jgi:hypothetical protein